MGTCAQSKPKRNPNVINVIKQQPNKWSQMENRPQIDFEPLQLRKPITIPPLSSISTENPAIKHIITNINDTFMQQQTYADEYDEIKRVATNQNGDEVNQVENRILGFYQQQSLQQNQDEQNYQDGDVLDKFKKEIQSLRVLYPFLSQQDINNSARTTTTKFAKIQHKDLDFIKIQPDKMTSQINISKQQNTYTTNIAKMNLLQADEHYIQGNQVSIKN